MRRGREKKIKGQSRFVAISGLLIVFSNFFGDVMNTIFVHLWLTVNDINTKRGGHLTRVVKKCVCVWGGEIQEVSAHAGGRKRMII